MAPSIEIMGGGDEASTAGGITASFTVAENSMDAVEGAAGAVLGLITLSDPDAGDTHTVEVDNDHFQVIDHAGAKWLTLKSGVSLDFEENETVTLTVTVTDSGDPAESASAEVTITVTDVNEAPSIDVRDGEEVPGHAGVVSSLTIAENAMRADAPPLALIEVMDPDAADQDHLKGDAGIAATSVSDDRFAVILDPEMGLWLHLAEGASLDYEDGDTVMVTVTFTDSAGNTASQDVTVMVTDVNDAPQATGVSVDPVPAEANQPLSHAIDLLNLFSDEDAGDNLTYRMTAGPSWLSFAVQYGEDDDGNDTVMGVLSGTPKPADSGKDDPDMVTITAQDSDGESASISFYVVASDGNEAPTDIDLIVDGQSVIDVEVSENTNSEIRLGRLTVDDDDHELHPHGQHKIEITAGDPRKRFDVKEIDGAWWLVLKEGASLDFEGDEGDVTLTLKATDINGELKADGRTPKGEDTEGHRFTILIKNEPDAPKAQQAAGNWWVTVDEDLDAEDVQEGQWLTFRLQSGDDPDSKDPNAAFTDLDPDDRLTYAIEVRNGTQFLDIDNTGTDRGTIRNKKGMLPPDDGVFDIRVTAEDRSKTPAHFDFQLTVAFSGADNEDNDDPKIENVDEFDYTENTGAGKVVATFSVADDDSHLTGHPFAPGKAEITGVVNADPPDDGDTSDYRAAFMLERIGTSNNYRIKTVDKPGGLDETRVLDYENVQDITITVRVYNDLNGNGEMDAGEGGTKGIDIDIVDVDEEPEAGRIAGTNVMRPDAIALTEENRINQSEDEKILLLIKLEDLWTDPEDPEDSSDLEFDATKQGSWIKILYGGPGQWDDLKDDNPGLTWANPDGKEGRFIGDPDTAADEPDPNEQVVIIEIDRTGTGSRNQNDVGSFTLTANDGTNTGRETYTITPYDENEPLGPGAVSVTGSAREGATLRARFDKTKDADLAGSASPALIVYTWSRLEGTDPDDADGETIRVATSGDSDSYTLTQADVDHKIRVTVSYHEVVRGNLVDPGESNVEAEASAFVRDGALVTNTPNEGTAQITILADGNALKVVDAGVRVTDGDYNTPGNLVPHSELKEFSWEWSDNGRGGWQPVPSTVGNPTDQGQTLTLADGGDGQGKYYRVKVAYDADGPSEDADAAEEHVYSEQVFRVGNIVDSGATPEPEITGSPSPGGTLRVSAADTSVQWQQQVFGGDWVDIPGEDSNTLQITQAHAGLTIRAVVSYHGKDGVTAVVAQGVNRGQPIPGATDSDPAAVGKHNFMTEAEPGSGSQAPKVSFTKDGIDLASLFEDTDTHRLTFSLESGGTAALGTDDEGDLSSVYVYEYVQGVLVFEIAGNNGKLTYVSDKTHGHDGNPDDDGDGDPDGDGNVITLKVGANDDALPDTTADDTADVTLRINVAPTGINFVGTEDGATASPTLTVLEQGKAGSKGTLIATLDVQDENSAKHGFGTHKVVILSGNSDDRFMITRSNFESSRDDGDGSTWELRLKPGKELDFEAENADRNPTIRLAFMATDKDGAGLSTPVGRSAPTLTITIEDVGDDDGSPNNDDPDDDPQGNHPLPTNDNDVPGLEDNESNNNDKTDDRDTGDHDDEDGGWTPPPPGMSIGLIEDFMGDMDGVEQDLLEDFMLVIDDGIEIA